MNRALRIAATGMESQQRTTDTIANNMANVNTTGYKRSVAHFQDMLYQTIATPGAANSTSESPVGIEIGSGVKTASISKNFTQGTLKNSSSSLDMAVEGDGFFEITLANGDTAFTRDGSFHLNSSGSVVTANGDVVVGFPTIGTDAESIDIARDGTVSTTVAGVSSNKGVIQLAKFTNPEGLSSIGYNMLSETIASGSPTRGNPTSTGYGGIAQHFLETSNVEIVKEMVDMIAAQRAYEMNSKSIKTADDMLRMANNLK